MQPIFSLFFFFFVQAADESFSFNMVEMKSNYICNDSSPALKQSTRSKITTVELNSAHVPDDEKSQKWQNPGLESATCYVKDVGGLAFFFFFFLIK